MNLDQAGQSSIPIYRQHLAKRRVFVLILLGLLVPAVLYALSTGSYGLGLSNLLPALAEPGSREALIIWNIRLPRITAAILVGASLGVAGAVMQCLLHNPLASPFTMGISHGAMFGASLGISLIGLGTTQSTGQISVHNPYLVVMLAFGGSLLSVAVILILARLRALGPGAIILAGVAMGSLFTAGTTLVQYFAEERQLAAMVYWSFGDLGRPIWKELALMASLAVPGIAYFQWKRWDYNAFQSGDDVARSLGVQVRRERLWGMLLASLITAVAVALVGIIGFVDLICAHIARLIVGSDYRFLLPSSALLGALLLVLADTAARSVLAPTILPVGVLTSFLGAPLFVYLIIRLEQGGSHVAGG